MKNKIKKSFIISFTNYNIFFVYYNKKKTKNK